MDEWKTAGGSNSDTTWDRSAPLTGKYVDHKSDVGPNNSMLYNVETEDGIVAVWGSTVLDARFEEVPIGSKVRIEYLGKKTSKAGTGFHDFDVKYIPPAEPQVANSTEITKENVDKVFPGSETVQ